MHCAKYLAQVILLGVRCATHFTERILHGVFCASYFAQGSLSKVLCDRRFARSAHRNVFCAKYVARSTSRKELHATSPALGMLRQPLRIKYLAQCVTLCSNRNLALLSPHAQVATKNDINLKSCFACETLCTDWTFPSPLSAFEPFKNILHGIGSLRRPLQKLLCRDGLPF